MTEKEARISVGKRIRELRKARGMTQTELANRLGYSHKTSISKIEAGINELGSTKLREIADVLCCSPSDLMCEEEKQPESRVFKIPVLGRVVAGYPMEAIENILDYEEIPESLARKGEFFALQVRGDSMEPRFKEGDVVIVQKQEDIESGDIAIFLINGDEATIKKVQKFEGGINLIPTNPAYNVLTFTAKQIIEMPVVCLGKVVELRAKFA